MNDVSLSSVVPVAVSATGFVFTIVVGMPPAENVNDVEAEEDGATTTTVVETRIELLGKEECEDEEEEEEATDEPEDV